MNNHFPQRLAALRKDFGYSQKQVSADLGISQALLSHYEKGVRECGLDFVVKAAEYYNVSCDYLLGKSDIKGLMQQAASSSRLVPSNESSLAYNYKLLSDSLDIVFCILEKINSDKLNKAMTSYMSTSIYRASRILCGQDNSVQGQGSKNTFLIDENVYSVQSAAAMYKFEARCKMLLLPDSKTAKRENRNASSISMNHLQAEYPELMNSLVELTQKIEKEMASVIVVTETE